MSRKYWLLLAGLALLVPANQSFAFQEKEADKTEQKKEEAEQKQDLSPIQQIKKLEKENSNLNRDFSQKVAKARKEKLSPAEMQKELGAAFREMQTTLRENNSKIVEVVKENPTAKGMKAFVLKSMPRDRTGQYSKIALEFYSEGDTLLPMVTTSALNPSASSKRVLKKVIESEASDKVKNIAKYGMESAKMARFRGDLEEVDTFSDELRGKLESLKDSLPKSFVKTALKKIDAFQNIRVGKVAPDITGIDIDGVNFKLSDYRGKVVFLDFWGDW